MNENEMHTHGRPDIIPEPIEVDYDNELVFRYRKPSEYPEPEMFDRIANWYDYNPVIKLED